MTPTASTIVFVDSTLDDYQRLANSAASDTEIVVLDAAQDGIAQITSALAGRSGVESVQILSHGNSGHLQLGSTQLNLTTLDQYSTQLQSWSQSLTDTADILLYGCNVAAGDSGNQFIQQFATLTGADIAASTNLTGNAALGGDWDLEAAVGQIETSLMLDRAILENYDSTLNLLFQETFTGADVQSRPWLFGRGVNTSANPFLTARGTVAASPDGLPGTANPIDQPGQGALRLTGAATDQATFVIYNEAIPSNAGLSITFDLFSYGGSGADGISFFLIDGRQSPEFAGGFGGSLGYAPRNTPTNVPGLRGGYVGIGFDEFGNFSAGTEGRTGGPGRRPNTVAIRGSQANNYAYLTGNSSLPDRIDNPSATTREQARRRVNIELDPTGLIDVQMDFNGDDDFDDPGELVIDSFNVVEANGSPLPATFKFGFASSTGNSTNIHEIRTFLIETVTTEQPNLPPIATSFSLAVRADALNKIAGPTGTDPDGTVILYVIRSLPPASQGTLFLGDPRLIERPLTVGQRLSAAQAEQLFFRATNQFSGTSFTFDAVDNERAFSESRATVSLVLPPGSGPGDPNTPPVAANTTFRVEPETTPRLLNALSATDSDGTIAFYTIGTLPQASQGTLFFGDPVLGGQPIRAGQQFNSNQIRQIFFRASDNFTGGSFTYTATDNDGARTVSPATVRLVSTDQPPGSSDPACGPGIRLIGDDADNTLQGTDGNDRISGLGGNDIIRGLGCDDSLNGGAGDDQLFGDDGNDVLFGDSGNDILRGGNGDDLLLGVTGNDVLYGENGNDRLYGEAGNDVLDGGSGNDLLRGGSGDDVLRGREGNDSLYGGDGNDRLEGGFGDDLLVGGEGNDVLLGKEGSDTLLGGAGDDVLIGGTGPDRLTGGEGRDTFLFTSYEERGDFITDFTPGVDIFDIGRVFINPAFSLRGEAAFRRYVELFQLGSNTIVRIRPNGDAGGQFRWFVGLENTRATDLSISDFNLGSQV
jgi:hypothetical protein